LSLVVGHPTHRMQGESPLSLASSKVPSLRLPAATTMPATRDDVGLVVMNAEHRSVQIKRSNALPSLLVAGDVLVLNDAATLPASLRGHTADGLSIELRLCHHHDGSRWRAVVFGAGDWRVRTEHRAPAPSLVAGARIEVAGLQAIVENVSSLSPRLIDLRFEADAATTWDAIYRAGRPVQYAHLTAPVPLWAVENLYADRPWAFEMPSAGRPLSWALLEKLRRAGVVLARLTHAAGLSATGDPAIDAALPLPERYEIPAATVDAITTARARGNRVVAVGTSAVRALESSASGGLRAGVAIADLRLGPQHELRIVDGLLTGLHDPGESHFSLLCAFAPAALLTNALHLAASHTFHSHEFGDLALILRSTRRP
jgi:S-adenosylmethionine:tRNA ribosyltransferase-isomerase